jgi:protoporphyrinogen oxidase
MGIKKGVAATLCLLKMPTRKSIAIVGGGITGSCAAADLAEHFERVVVYDQGRRGPGGRASHRSVKAADETVLADDSIIEPLDTTTFEFDHGEHGIVFMCNLLLHPIFSPVIFLRLSVFPC